MPTVQMPDGTTQELDYGLHDRLKAYAERTGDNDELGYTPDQFAVAIAVAARDPQYRSEGEWPPVVRELIRRVSNESNRGGAQPEQPAPVAEPAGMGSPMPQPQQPQPMSANVLPFPQQPATAPAAIPAMQNPFLQGGQPPAPMGQYRRRGQTPQDRVQLLPMASFLRR